MLRRLGHAAFAMMRWRVEGNLPALSKFVVIVAPHTSNWDFIVGIAALLALDLRANWLGKDTLFRGPAGSVLRRLGGIAVRRDAPHNVVEHMVQEFAVREQLVLGIAPEGTRHRVDHWRTGFWHIARRAGVPIVAVSLDYRRRVARMAAPFWPTESLEEDVAMLRRMYEGVVPHSPERW